MVKPTVLANNKTSIKTTTITTTSRCERDELNLRQAIYGPDSDDYERHLCDNKDRMIEWKCSKQAQKRLQQQEFRIVMSIVCCKKLATSLGTK